MQSGGSRPLISDDAKELVVSVTDAGGYLCVVLVMVKVVCSQGFLKICVTFLSKNYNPDSYKASTE